MQCSISQHTACLRATSPSHPSPTCPLLNPISTPSSPTTTTTTSHQHHLFFFFFFFFFHYINFNKYYNNNNTYNNNNMPPRRFHFGRTEDAIHPDTMRAALSEFIATAIFVFAAEGSVLSLGKLYKDTSTAGGLVLVAIAHALALFVAVSVAFNVSGGHVNPAVTFGALVGGRISFLLALYYWIAQLLGAVAASLLLRITTGGMRPLGFSVGSGVGELNAFLLEIVMTFGLVYTVYATAIDPKRGHLVTIAPLAIGFILGANILAGGPFDGAAMNPARAFGPALVGWRWRHHWIYWVGPFIGAGIAGVIYEFVVIPVEVPHTHQPLAPEDY